MAWFRGNRPDHPMANFDQAKELVAEFSVHDYMKALEEAVGWLDSIVQTPEFTLAQRYALYDLIDQATRSHQSRLARGNRVYADRPGFQRNARSRAALQLWKALANAYLQCIDLLQAGDSAAGAVRKDYAIIAARALRALTLQLKTMLMHYGAVEPSIWRDLGRLYRYAEVRGGASTPLEVYPGARDESTVQREFLKAMMLGVSSMQALTPGRQEIAEHAIAHYAHWYAISESPAPYYNYCFDLERDEPPMRRWAGSSAGQGMRFFGAADALPALALLIQEISSSGSVPPEINLGGTYRPAAVLPVLEHLQRHWTDQSPTRRSERRKIGTRLTVARGFRAILGTLVEADDTSLDAKTIAKYETWIVEDVSEGGLGATIPDAQDDTVKVGNVLGVRSEAAPGWSVALVRRLTRERSGRRHAGLQLLYRTAILVELAVPGQAAGAQVNDRALLLSTSADANGEIPLLVREGGFSRGQVLEMKAQGKSYEIMAARLVEGGDDYDWAMYKIIAGTRAGVP